MATTPSSVTAMSNTATSSGAETILLVGPLASQLCGWDAGFLTKANEFSYRFDLKFLHDPTAMDFDRFLGNT
jgi:hypothetical protein